MRARTRPSHTATRQQANDSTVFSSAFNQSPSRAKSSVCKLKDGCVTTADTDHEKLPELRRHKNGPSGSVNAAKNPTRKEPVTFTTRVPTGKNSPPRSAMNPDIQKSRSSPRCAAEHH